ncbi:glycosyltransferase family 2 protein [Patescibacteria group bacterium]|nr:glycosyltransferase family 2 protein [Patescibacteria group bacterium]
MQKEVFIILLNWNNEGDTIECIESLKKNNYKNYKIIVIDNGSEKESIAKIERQYSDLYIIKNKSNLGFAGGCNVGTKYAIDNNADYVLLLNNDTTVAENFLTKLIRVGEADEEVGILGSKIYYHTEKNRIWFAGGKVNWLKNKGTHLGLDEIDEGQFNEMKEVDYLTGCCLLVKREVLDKIGVLAEDYFLYYEDTDYSLRAKNAGFKCIFVPESVIYHKISRSTKPGSASYIYYHVRNGLVMAKRNGNFFVKLALYHYCVILFFKQIIKISFSPQKRPWANAVLRALRDFLSGKMGMT